MRSELEFLYELLDEGEAIMPCDKDCDCNYVIEKVQERIEELCAIKTGDEKDE